ncbi:MAG: hypothetical protein M0Z55_10820 [Peptococcaceae bacterium]|nr:hypothetical protein [Peptococcaceae bacterium]
MGTDLFTTSYLGTFAGLVAATYLLVQFFKEPIKKRFNDWWVRLLAVLIAFVLQSFVLYVNGKVSVESVGLALLNAFLIAITAAGTHQLSTSAKQNGANPLAATNNVQPLDGNGQPKAPTGQ